MGLFTNNDDKIISKKDFDLEEAEKILKEKYDLADIDPRDLGEIKSIVKMAAELGLHDSNNLPGDIVSLLKEIDKQQKLAIEQRFLQIKQKDRINKSLEQLFYLLEDKVNI